MSARTSIEWTDRSSNPLRAYNVDTGKRGWFCVHASDGCRSCYAERRNRWIGNGLHYTADNLKRVRFEMDAKELSSWARLAPGTKVFPFDMTDLFQEGVPDALISQAFGAMAGSPATFQVLTKRAQRLAAFVSSPMTSSNMAGWMKGNLRAWVRDTPWNGPWPLPNVWLGVSVEDQATADARIPLLLQTPAAKRFISYEPALGPIDFSDGPLDPESTMGSWSDLDQLDWVIVGGESGPGARSFDVAWARSTVAQCKAAGVACFVKQLGRFPFSNHPEPGWSPLFEDSHGRVPSGEYAPRIQSAKGGDMAEWPEDLRVREFPA